MTATWVVKTQRLLCTSPKARRMRKELFDKGGGQGLFTASLVHHADTCRGGDTPTPAVFLVLSANSATYCVFCTCIYQHRFYHTTVAFLRANLNAHTTIAAATQCFDRLAHVRDEQLLFVAHVILWAVCRTHHGLPRHYQVYYE